VLVNSRPSACPDSPGRPPSPVSVPGTWFQCVCTRRRNASDNCRHPLNRPPAARQINPRPSSQLRRDQNARRRKVRHWQFWSQRQRPFDTLNFLICWARFRQRASACSKLFFFWNTGTDPGLLGGGAAIVIRYCRGAAGVTTLAESRRAIV